jgi:hypothetical protein
VRVFVEPYEQCWHSADILYVWVPLNHFEASLSRASFNDH